MISLKKFQQLPLATQKRKLWRLACELEAQLRRQNGESGAQIKNDQSCELEIILNLISQSPSWPKLFPADGGLAIRAQHLILRATNLQTIELVEQSATIRAANELRHLLAKQIGQESAEWDLLPRQEGSNAAVPTDNPELFNLTTITAKPGSRLRLVFCDNIRSPFNIGSLFRTAEAFGLSGIILSPDCPALNHPRLQRSAMRAIDWIPAQIMTFAEAREKFRIPVFAIELGGDNIKQFNFPEHGMAVLGSEELGIQPEIIELCRQSGGIVTIPLVGAKASLNVGVSFGIVAAEWNL